MTTLQSLYLTILLTKEDGENKWETNRVGKRMRTKGRNYESSFTTHSCRSDTNRIYLLGVHLLTRLCVWLSQCRRALWTQETFYHMMRLWKQASVVKFVFKNFINKFLKYIFFMISSNKITWNYIEYLCYYYRIDNFLILSKTWTVSLLLLRLFKISFNSLEKSQLLSIPSAIAKEFCSVHFYVCMYVCILSYICMCVCLSLVSIAILRRHGTWFNLNLFSGTFANVFVESAQWEKGESR